MIKDLLLYKTTLGTDKSGCNNETLLSSGLNCGLFLYNGILQTKTSSLCKKKDYCNNNT